MTHTETNSVFTIPPHFSFTDELAKGLLKETENHHHLLARYTILLPTRRACRTLQEAFLKQTDGKPLLLPKIMPIGDIDADELFLHIPQLLQVPPAISPLKRQLLLTKLIGQLPLFSHDIVQDMALATSLGQLMDQIHTEGKNLDDLPDLVDRDLFANHWQITLDFLTILSEHWPKILKGLGAIDASDRRNRLSHALNDHWIANPPSVPIIAAGSTGSIPSTTNLLKTISKLPNGRIILPGVDLRMSSNAWDKVDEGHPQKTLKNLIEHLNYKRTDVSLWPYLSEAEYGANNAREWLSSYMMLPAESTDEWQDIVMSGEQKKALNLSLSKLHRYDCENLHEEASLIAILLRETLETTNKTVALITPDRMLARRVATICQRWDIEIDDSAGTTLLETSIGQYLSLCVHAAAEDFKPSAFLALLKHNHCHGNKFKNFRKTVRLLDRDLLRGLRPKNGIQGIKERYTSRTNDPKIKNKPSKEISSFLNHAEELFSPLLKNKKNNFCILLKLHIELAEKLSSTDELEGSNVLWSSGVGENISNFLSELFFTFDDFPEITLQDYIKIFDHLLTTVTYRPTFGMHPRVTILGQLEARMTRADRIILSGLNEGTWPPEPSHSPWLSRSMKKDFGLPLPERNITLAAHDFTQGFCSSEVFLTRSSKIDGNLTVTARWLERLDTFLQTLNISPTIIKGSNHLILNQDLENVSEVVPLERPAPRPPQAARPRSLSVTRIETWLNDPYSIYAEKILRLNPLDNLEKPIDYAEKGTLLHDILYKFILQNKQGITKNSELEFIEIAKDVLHEHSFKNEEWRDVLPRLYQISNWFIEHEKEWREISSTNKLEVKGKMTIETALDHPFILTGQADRIDKLHSGLAAIIDYKSAGTYTKKGLKNASNPQLPLEALMLENGAFEQQGLSANEVGYLGYWTITGNAIGGVITAIDNKKDIDEAVTIAQTGLEKIITVFEDEQTPYYAVPNLEKAPRFNNYAYLERIKEWAVTDDNGEEAA